MWWSVSFFLSERWKKKKVPVASPSLFLPFRFIFVVEVVVVVEDNLLPMLLLLFVPVSA